MLKKKILIILTFVVSLTVLHTNIVFGNSISEEERDVNTTESDKQNYYTIKYHNDENSKASDKTTVVTMGVKTKTLTSAELNFSNGGKAFKGWKVYRESDQCWYFRNETESLWSKEKPEGYDYYIYGDGTTSAYTGNYGDIVHFYATWIENSFTIKYYCDEKEEKPSSQLTVVQYGNDTATLTIQKLGFSKQGKVFLGWKVYREEDKKYRFLMGMIIVGV